MNDYQDLPARLRSLRAGRKLTQDKLAAALKVSKSLIQQFESGKLIPQDDTAADLDEFFGTGTEIRKLAKEGREDRQPWLRSWVEQERRALLLRTWEPMVVPGLLQCEAYMREVFAATPRNAGRVDDLVANRLQRQADTIHRDDNPVAMSAIIGEMALHRGPKETLKKQVGHLVDVGHLPHVKIRLIPAEDEMIHAGLSGPLVIAYLTDGRRAGLLDNQLTGQPVTGHSDLGQLELTWSEIDALALPVVQTRDAMLRMINDRNL
ncbi:helix-turn-helix transcriptional regulator [Solwaraspora sp. WMMD1047]|uniref:helix-turn-helix domain-containing protein n=1 Tax=Solwaraspora sp. WMMD1047 TaxID=3016102 RepID=UPI002417C36E|nr:helix-turn-helix transcriptional regulator [Solwaraspora sp. WMMD1047]MDG4832081.1 helix-turn-helix transcriptional regulator [Solwaraspora sp. WMMD1047]